MDSDAGSNDRQPRLGAHARRRSKGGRRPFGSVYGRCRRHALARAPPVQPPRKHRKHEESSGHHHQHQIRTQSRQPPEVVTQLRPLIRCPALAVTRLHQNGHQAACLLHFGQQTLLFALRQIADRLKSPAGVTADDVERQHRTAGANGQEIV